MHKTSHISFCALAVSACISFSSCSSDEPKIEAPDFNYNGYELNSYLPEANPNLDSDEPVMWISDGGVSEVTIFKFLEQDLSARMFRHAYIRSSCRRRSDKNQPKISGTAENFNKRKHPCIVFRSSRLR